MKILLASAVLLLSACAAHAADPTPWGVQTPGSDWVSITFKNGATCWMSSKAFRAAGENAPVALYSFTKDTTIAGVTVYRAAACSVGGTTKMMGQVMGNNEMIAPKPGTGSFLVGLDDAILGRAKKSLEYASKLLGSK